MVGRDTKTCSMFSAHARTYGTRRKNCPESTFPVPEFIQEEVKQYDMSLDIITDDMGPLITPLSFFVFQENRYLAVISDLCHA